MPTSSPLRRNSPDAQEGTPRRGAVKSRMTARKGLVFSVHGGPEASSNARRAILAGDGAVPPSAREDILLLVSELVTNGVRHNGVGPDRSLHVALQRSPQRVRVEVSQPGNGFRQKPETLPLEGGRRLGPDPGRPDRGPLGDHQPRGQHLRVVRARALEATNHAIQPLLRAERAGPSGFRRCRETPRRDRRVRRAERSGARRPRESILPYAVPKSSTSRKNPTRPATWLPTIDACRSPSARASRIVPSDPPGGPHDDPALGLAVVRERRGILDQVEPEGGRRRIR